MTGLADWFGDHPVATGIATLILMLLDWGMTVLQHRERARYSRNHYRSYPVDTVEGNPVAADGCEPRTAPRAEASRCGGAGERTGRRDDVVDTRRGASLAPGLRVGPVLHRLGDTPRKPPRLRRKSPRHPRASLDAPAHGLRRAGRQVRRRDGTACCARAVLRIRVHHRDGSGWDRIDGETVRLDSEVPCDSRRRRRTRRGLTGLGARKPGALPRNLSPASVG